MEFQVGEIQATPRDLVLGMLVALGVLVIVRDLLRMADVLSMAEQHRQDPNKLAEEALEFLGQQPDKREEEYDDGNDGT